MSVEFYAMKAIAQSVEIGAGDLTGFDAYIDTRSPAEFAEDHIPGALNAPVLDDAERARVGTLYKVSPFEAKKLGAALVARNIARHVETLFASQGRGWRPLVYCWRGGKRSAAMAHVLREIGWGAATLQGGYKAYRRWVVERLAHLPGTLTFRVIHGATGSGKSRLLRALSRAGAQVLDLEALAAHRGSVLGELPHLPQPTQKWFESELLRELSGFDPARTVYAEGESRKIGELQLPEALVHAMRAADCVRLEARLAVRVALLLEEYGHFLEERAALETQLDCLAGLHGRERIAEWKALAAHGAWPQLVERLLAEHYDPAYRKSAERNFARLPDALRLEVGSPAEREYERLAQALLEHEAVAA
jgi:tRNA 2-selenouridine synthase